MSARTLTESEVALVKRWARRGRIWFWFLLPLGVVVIGGGLVMAAASFIDHHWFTGLTASVVSPAVALVFYLWRGSIKTYSSVTASTPVVTKSGVLRLKRIGRSFTPAIDDLAVEFVSADVRRAVELDAPCVVEVILDAPVLVITARPS